MLSLNATPLKEKKKSFVQGCVTLLGSENMATKTIKWISEFILKWGGSFLISTQEELDSEEPKGNS